MALCTASHEPDGATIPGFLMLLRLRADAAVLPFL
jgi:hypothetical protein